MFCTLVTIGWYLNQFAYNIHATCKNKNGFRERDFIIQYLHVCVYCIVEVNAKEQPLICLIQTGINYAGWKRHQM